MTTLQRPGPSAPADGPRGVDLLNHPALNKGTAAFTEDERSELGLHGLLPPRVEGLDQQVARASEAYTAEKTTTWSDTSTCGRCKTPTRCSSIACFSTTSRK